MLLVSNKQPFFDIVIAADASACVRYAAEELQRYVDRISMCYVPIRIDEPTPGRSALLIGDSPMRRKLFPATAKLKLEGEQYVLQTRRGNLLALGGTDRGTLYAVYDLLERLGVRWWTPEDETVPARNVLEAPELDVRVDPPLIYRATWYRNAMDADWQARMRLNAGTMQPVYLRDRHGGMERFAADATAHTYQGLVPTEEYFDSHPEYFSMVNGQRLRHHNQLCPTHPDVARIAADTARQWLDATPGCRIVSVTQNDWRNWCTCPTCAAMIEREGAPSGPMLHLANEVARLLEHTHPHALVDTFAYSWSEEPPRHLKAHPSVLVRIAPIGNCNGHPIRTCPANERYRRALGRWSTIARHLFVWHYVTDFFHYLTPFPNLPPLADDLRLYLDHGVKGMFMQGDGTSLGGDLAELKTYLIARLMWNPKLDAQEVRAEFLGGYYRAAAPFVEEYVSTFERAFARAGHKEHLFLYRTLWQNEARYLARPVLERARKAVARGQRACADDPQVLRRLDRLVAALDYTELFYYERPAKRMLSRGRLECPSSPRRQELAGRLFQTAAAHGITHYGEDLGRYTRMEELRRAWHESAGKHEVVRLQAGGSEAVIVPALGGRIVHYGPTRRKQSVLGQGSPDTFGYPCTGGYEEYSRRCHQSPGFSQAFEVSSSSRSQVGLEASLDTGLILRRRIRLDAGTGEVAINTTLRNPHEQPLPGCLRAHLEIDLDVPPSELAVWFLCGRKWQRQDFGGQGPGGTWYDGDVPRGWLFWSEPQKLGVYQRWPKGCAGAAFLGTIPAEPTVVALDLARGRCDEPIPGGGSQKIRHRFGWITALPSGCA